ADSMKARGYGLKGRTNFSLFKWNSRDYSLLVMIGSIFLFVMYLNVKGVYKFNYYPLVSRLDISINHVLDLSIIFILIILLTLVELKDKLSWRYYKSKI